ncbi:MAG: hypothetical protein NTX73_18105 [Rhodobacterales bacterium]|jgi:hypothetical protein|nr:hypothetical protein [Rhodobacterales bacterium]
MKRLLPVLLIVIASQAQALKCPEQSVAVSFRDAMSSADNYVILRGKFDFDATLLPGGPETRGDPNLPAPATVPARFVGQSLVEDGFTHELDIPVTLSPTCLGPWCGTLTPGQDIMAFATTDGRGTVAIELHPCAKWIFVEPQQPMLDEMLACMTGSACADSP